MDRIVFRRVKVPQDAGARRRKESGRIFTKIRQSALDQHSFSLDLFNHLGLPVGEDPAVGSVLIGSSFRGVNGSLGSIGLSYRFGFGGDDL
ncbi:MAG: hypothetical protein R3324_18520, partial [Halobacteriales archaeon]|nr:hypothetical protein [Halobacteriales archaeon]